jgi:hypothetical protein
MEVTRFLCTIAGVNGIGKIIVDSGHYHHLRVCRKVAIFLVAKSLCFERCTQTTAVG